MMMEEPKEPKERFVKEEVEMLAAQVPKAMVKKVEEIVQRDMHASKSEFIREALRKHIKDCENDHREDG